ncbi:MAG: hypothetical protein WAW61_12365 [Methylococcaceae bacterium]
MSSFKRIASDFIGSKYEGGIKVFLESTEDVRIFSDHWFSHYQDKIRFESAEDDGKKGGGCNAVLRKVKEAENQQLTAYGIVDRDKLLGDENKQDIFWETDDDKFHASSPYGHNIHVLRRWEMENYLLKPEAFRAELQCRISNRLAPEITAGTLLNHEEDLIKLTAFSTVLANKSISAPDEGFGRAYSGEGLHAELNNYLSPSKITLESSEFSKDINKISAFTNNEENPEIRWDKLSRILDGKRALYKFCSIFHQEYKLGGFQFVNEIKGCLANRIASKRELLDEELCTTIERFSK